MLAHPAGVVARAAALLGSSESRIGFGLGPAMLWTRGRSGAALVGSESN